MLTSSRAGSPPHSARPGNQLLTLLSIDDFARIRPRLQTVAVSPRQMLHRTGEPVRYVYFPNGGVYSIITVLSGGATIEVSAVGDEGMLGIEAFFDAAPHALGDVVLQLAESTATAERLDVLAFRGELARLGGLHEAVAAYIKTLIALMMQSTACNAVHSLPQRCCRWLLDTEDRVHTGDLRLTQEFLAAMLGARRPTVTRITRDLQGAGLLRYTRGRIRIVNRQGLEARSCECYGAVRRHRPPRVRTRGGGG